MTLQLLLIRHAKSDWEGSARLDHERPLNERGRRDAPRMGRWIADKGLAPEEVLCSDAARTRETLDLMLPLWAPVPRLSHHHELYHATPEAMLSVLEEAQAPRVALIGHNPGIGLLAARLAEGTPRHSRWEDFPTCAVAAFSFPVDNWFDILEGRGKILAFAIPADLA